MKTRKFIQLSGFMIFINLIGCTEKQETPASSELPEHQQNIESLTLIAPDEEAVPDSVKLIRETVFESTDEVFIEGYISRLAVDNEDRVYIAATIPGTVGVYVFDHDGEFNTRFTREGRGPGEYEAISSMQIVQDTLYIFDGRLQKMGQFSTRDFSHIGDMILQSEFNNAADTLLTSMRGRSLIVTNTNKYILHKQHFSAYRQEGDPLEAFYKISRTGKIIGDPLLVVERFPFYFPIETERPELPFPMPFTRSSLVSITKDGRFFTNWTDDLLIKMYNSDGELEEQWHASVTKSKLNMNDFKLSRLREQSLAQYDMPETWPAVHTMELDDEERLWVATITDSDSTYQWRVISPEGQLLARFEKAGKRTSRSVMTKPLIKIHNGYFYERERDLQRGIDRIVKHKIDFIDRSES